MKVAKMLHIALYQPGIPQNVGAAIRLCACLDLTLDIIEPCGFPWDEKKIKQAGMDYLNEATIIRHNSWDAFKSAYDDWRFVLMTTKASVAYTDFDFSENDILIAGRESAGVPDFVHKEVGGRVLIPMSGKARSLNIINATAMITSEALRQIKL